MIKIQIVLTLRGLSGVKALLKTGKIHASMKFSLMIQIVLLLGLGDTLKHILLSQGG